MPELKIIDIHAHAAGPGDKKQGLYWHKRFADDPNFQKLKFIKGISLKKISDKLMINSLLKQTRSTVNEIDNIVILAFDNVYDVDGTFRGPAYDSGKEILGSPKALLMHNPNKGGHKGHIKGTSHHINHK